MIFMVEQADHYKKYEDYGLPTMAITFYEEILVGASIGYREDVSFCFSEIEINTLEELLDFQKRCNAELIIGENDIWFKSLAKKYKYSIKIYNYYIE